MVYGEAEKNFRVCCTKWEKWGLFSSFSYLMMHCMLEEHTYQKASLEHFILRQYCSGCDVVRTMKIQVSSTESPCKHVMSRLCFSVLSCGVLPTIHFSFAHIVCVTKSPGQQDSCLCCGRQIWAEMMTVSSPSIISKDLFSTNRWCHSVYFQTYICKVTHVLPQG